MLRFNLCLRPIKTLLRLFMPQPLRVVQLLFSPIVSGWADIQSVGGGWAGSGKIFPGYISEAARCRRLILGRDIGWGM